MHSDLSRDEIQRYSRHLLIPEVGLEGQLKLKRARVLLVGTGGLGSPVSLYLAAAGVGHLGLVDFDVVDATNLQRQVVHGTASLGVLKVESARRRLQDVNPFIEIETYNEQFTSVTAMQIARGYDLIIDGTDNFPTRYLINDVAVFLGIPCVYGSVFRFEGQVSVFDASRGPCYRCLFPEPPPPGTVPSCAEAGILGVLPGTIGTLQATEAIKLITGVGEPLIGRLLLYDAMDMSFQTVKLRKNPKCRVCGQDADIHELIDYDEFCGVPGRAHADEGSAGPGWDIEPLELAALLQSGSPPRLVDVRSLFEAEISNLPGAMLIPLDDLPARLDELPRDQDIVLFCRMGVRSAAALDLLRQSGFTRLRNLHGGINAWAQQVNPSLPQY